MFVNISTSTKILLKGFSYSFESFNLSLL